MVPGLRVASFLRPCLPAVLGVGLLAGCGGAPEDAPVGSGRTGDLLGEPPPGPEATVFAPGLVSTQHRQRDTAIPGDGGLFLYTLWGGGRGTLIELRRAEDGAWSSPEIASFSGVHSDIEPFFHPDGQRLYFASKRPLPGETEPGDWNLWSVRRTADGWTDPAPLDGINTDGDEFYPAVTRDGTVYFTAQRDGGVGGEDLFRARPDGDGFAAAQSLSEAVNSPGPEFNAYVSPDETVLIFSSVREGDHGGGDLYASFRDETGPWTPALNLGPRVNGPALDYCPFVTPDGRHLFFSSTRSATADEARRSYPDLLSALEGPANGQGSIYWIDAAVLEEISGARLDSH